ncbi:MAG: NAD(P)H-quinone oxidoreductase [Actinomycetota bacterium]|nr:NAD(P)H-quinone oxidoreductase [Actinomycetota bacterium]
MRAVTLPGFGGPEVLTLADVEDPEPGPGELLINVVATAVNRADLLQRMGFYSPPAGASAIPGLECSGRVAALGEGVAGWAVGDEVCALLAGGGYAEKVAVPAGQVLPVPAGVSLRDAAALPEVTCTVWSNVWQTAGLQPGEILLVHGGTSGIGTMAIQLAARFGARVFTTVGSEQKAEVARSLGAERAIRYRDEDFVEVLSAVGGADVILDNMGAAYLGRNVEALTTGGRLVVIGLQGGTRGELDLAGLLGKRGAVHATSLRARPGAQKAAIVEAVLAGVWPSLESGDVRPVIDRAFPLADVADAHRLIEASEHIGKVLLTVS